MESTTNESIRPHHGPVGVDTVALSRLRSIAGQVEGIQRMVEQERYCMDIVDQISAARAALAKVSSHVLQRHIEHCVVRDLRHGEEEDQDRVVAELIQVFSKSMK